jgi:poly-gamma-glutamate synthesis protein (capsule biosynthesis protein)
LVHRLDVNEMRSVIASAAKQSPEVLVASFHWGVEYSHTTTVRQTEQAHAAIDAGADIVVGHHPHVLQGIETYRGGLVLYSLGNFVFDQVGEDQNETMVARVTVAPSPGDGERGERTLELVPMRIRDTFPHAATFDESRVTLERVASWSDPVLASQITSGRIRW